MLSFDTVSNMFFTNAGMPGASETSNIGPIPVYSYCYDTVGKKLYFCSDATLDAMVWNIVTDSYSSGSYDFTGPWASAQSTTIRLSLNGKSVCMTISEVYTAATSASGAVISTAIPVQYRPVVDTFIPIIAYDNSATQFGNIGIPTTGIITINPTSYSENYTEFGDCGWKGISVSWIVS